MVGATNHSVFMNPPTLKEGDHLNPWQGHRQAANKAWACWRTNTETFAGYWGKVDETLPVMHIFVKSLERLLTYLEVMTAAQFLARALGEAHLLNKCHRVM